MKFSKRYAIKVCTLRCRLTGGDLRARVFLLHHLTFYVFAGP